MDIAQLGLGLILILGAIAGGSVPIGDHQILLATMAARLVAAIAGLYLAFPKFFTAIVSALWKRRYIVLALIVILVTVSILAGQWMNGTWQVASVDWNTGQWSDKGGTIFKFIPVGPYVKGDSIHDAYQHDGYLITVGILAWGHWHKSNTQGFSQEVEWLACCITPTGDLTVITIPPQFSKLVLKKTR